MSFGVTEAGEKVHVCSARRPGWPDTCPHCGPVSTWLQLWEPRRFGFARWTIELRTYEPGWRHHEGPYVAALLAQGWWRPPPGWRFTESLLETPKNGPGFVT